MDVNFRDESDKIAGRYGAYPESQRVATPDSRKTSTGQIGHYRSRFHPHVWQRGEKLEANQSILINFHPPIEEVAVTFLLSSYVAESHFDYLPSVYKDAISDGPLMTCIRAVGLVGVSQDSGQLDLMNMARRQYTYALRTTNAALQSPEKAVLDETLAAVMLLSLFETVSHDDQEPSEKWTSHVDGALTLLTCRGPQQFQSPLGRALFMQISNNIRVSCVQNRRRIPAGLLSLTAQASPFLDTANPASRFSAIVEAFTDLRAAVDDGGITEPASRVRLAQEIDDECLSLALDMPDGWLYDVAYTNTHDIAIFRTEYHIYKTHRIAQMWNTIRMTRLLLNEMIWGNLATALPNCSWLRDPPAQIARNMAEEILASLPQFTQFSPNGSKLYSPTLASSCFLLWPLEVVGTSPLSTPPMRAYVINRLRYMGIQMKVRQALGVAEKLEQGSLSQDW